METGSAGIHGFLPEPQLRGKRGHALIESAEKEHMQSPFAYAGLMMQYDFLRNGATQTDMLVNQGAGEFGMDCPI